MGALSGRDILSRMLFPATVEERLVVTPILSESQIDEDQASIDLRLGSVFLTFRRGHTTTIDWSDHGRELGVDRTYVRLGERFVIHPNQFVLAQTLEYVRMPGDLLGYVVTRSSWGRTGLIVATAVGIQPNFTGVITLELRNLGDVPVELWPGTSILQLFLHSLSGATHPKERTYSRATETTAPHPSFDEQLKRMSIVPLPSAV
jgi:dCTP deaminase